ncbi:MAG TPA: HAD-IB family hydrolase [Steroidobacteraceae bacterium]|nr:HAD-IB family hydrolase [Steroidobacteraceae bacterium]
MAGSVLINVANRAAQLWRIVATPRWYHAPMPIAIFDLDGTITHRDTLFPLVLGLLARPQPLRLLRLLRVAPATVRFSFDRDRAALKQSLLRATLRGTPRNELYAACTAFVSDTIAHRCFKDALAAIRRHRDAGHHLVLMSASVDFYVPEFGRQLGFDQVISTGVAWNGERLDGTLTTPNRRGEEKAICLRALVAERRDAETFAYGNSDSDLPHLQIAKHGLLVNGSTAARRAAAAVGVPCAEWV